MEEYYYTICYQVTEQNKDSLYMSETYYLKKNDELYKKSIL